MIPLSLTDEEFARIAAKMAEQGVSGPYRVDSRRFGTESTTIAEAWIGGGNRHKRRSDAVKLSRRARRVLWPG